MVPDSRLQGCDDVGWSDADGASAVLQLGEARWFRALPVVLLRIMGGLILDVGGA